MNRRNGLTSELSIFEEEMNSNSEKNPILIQHHLIQSPTTPSQKPVNLDRLTALYLRNQEKRNEEFNLFALGHPLVGGDNRLSEMDQEVQEELKKEANKRTQLNQETNRRLQQKKEAEKLEQQRLEAEKLEQQKLKTERLKQQKLEVERQKQQLKAERLKQQKLEVERQKQQLEAEKLKQQRLEAERLEQQRLEAERLEQKRLEAEKLEQQRLEAELVAQALEELAKSKESVGLEIDEVNKDNIKETTSAADGRVQEINDDSDQITMPEISDHTEKNNQPEEKRISDTQQNQSNSTQGIKRSYQENGDSSTSQSRHKKQKTNPQNKSDSGSKNKKDKNKKDKFSKPDRESKKRKRDTHNSQESDRPKKKSKSSSKKDQVVISKSHHNKKSSSKIVLDNPSDIEEMFSSITKIAGKASGKANANKFKRSAPRIKNKFKALKDKPFGLEEFVELCKEHGYTLVEHVTEEDDVRHWRYDLYNQDLEHKGKCGILMNIEAFCNNPPVETFVLDNYKHENVKKILVNIFKATRDFIYHNRHNKTNKYQFLELIPYFSKIGLGRSCRFSEVENLAKFHGIAIRKITRGQGLSYELFDSDGSRIPNKYQHIDVHDENKGDVTVGYEENSYPIPVSHKKHEPEANDGSETEDEIESNDDGKSTDIIKLNHPKQIEGLFFEIKREKIRLKSKKDDDPFSSAISLVTKKYIKQALDHDEFIKLCSKYKYHFVMLAKGKFGLMNSHGEIISKAKSADTIQLKDYHWVTKDILKNIFDLAVEKVKKSEADTVHCTFEEALSHVTYAVLGRACDFSEFKKICQEHHLDIVKLIYIQNKEYVLTDKDEVYGKFSEAHEGNLSDKDSHPKIPEKLKSVPDKEKASKSKRSSNAEIEKGSKKPKSKGIPTTLQKAIPFQGVDTQPKEKMAHDATILGSLKFKKTEAAEAIFDKIVEEADKTTVVNKEYKNEFEQAIPVVTQRTFKIALDLEGLKKLFTDNFYELVPIDENGCDIYQLYNSEKKLIKTYEKENNPIEDVSSRSQVTTPSESAPAKKTSQTTAILTKNSSGFFNKSSSSTKLSTTITKQFDKTPSRNH